MRRDGRALITEGGVEEAWKPGMPVNKDNRLRQEEGGPKLKLTLHATGMSYHTAFLWFCGQNFGPQNADLFTNLSQSHSLLEKIRAVASKVAVAFLPFSSFPETEPRASVHSTQALSQLSHIPQTCGYY